jgi:serine/threonine protein kinase
MPTSETRGGSNGASEGWRVGGTIDRWTLVEELGRGGMGVVYAAADAEGRRVAIKCLPLSANPTSRARFQREGEVMARVDGHPNVLRVHAAGARAGRLYLVLDLASRGDLAGRLRERGRLDPEEARRVVLGVARGVAHVHDHGVLHRDLKPSNVLFDERDNPKLVDFGVAWALDARDLTRTGQMVGTAAYMAPEQVDAAKHADARTDVYGLGALLFACLSGGPPLGEGSSVNAIYALLKTPAPPLRSLVPDAHPALEAICARALEKNPEARFPTAAAFADALSSAVLDAAPETGSLGAGRWVGGAIALLLCALALGAGWRLTQEPKPELSTDPGSRATAPRTPKAAPAPPAAPPPWPLPAGATLRYALEMTEKTHTSMELKIQSTVTLRVRAAPAPEAVLPVEGVSPRPGLREVAVCWEFSDASLGQVGTNAPYDGFQWLHDVTQGARAFTARVDLHSGAIQVTDWHLDEHRRLRSVVSRMFPGGEAGDDDSNPLNALRVTALALIDNAYRNWLTLPKVLNLLLARPHSMKALGVEWIPSRGTPGRATPRYPDPAIRSVPNFNWAEGNDWKIRSYLQNLGGDDHRAVLLDLPAAMRVSQEARLANVKTGQVAGAVNVYELRLLEVTSAVLPEGGSSPR